MTPEEELKKSEQDKKIVEDPICVEANDKLKKELMDEIVNSPIRDTEAREKLYFMIKMHESVLNQLKSIMETGKLIKK